MDPLTIVFALVAVLVIWKLNSVLGSNTGFQGPRIKNVKTRTSAPRDPEGRETPRNDNVVRLPGPAAVRAPQDLRRWTASLDPDADPGTAAALEAIAGADPAFSAAPFLDGARTAYEAIVTAFAAGERQTLQSLLERDVFDGFEAALREREARRETLTTTFVAIDEARFWSASLDGRMARVGVRFLSKQIAATRAADGHLVSGCPDQVHDATDSWVFSRDTRSRDPNWKLAATQSGA